METIELIFRILMEQWQRAATGGIIVACAVIFIMGIVKKAALGKIKNKLLRKVVLSFTSLALTFPVTALYFVGDGISFEWYWYGCALMCVLTIITYWLYENTGLRNLIALIGQNTVGKYITVLLAAVVSAKDDNDTKNKLTMTTDELQHEVKNVLKKQIKEDNQLKGL